jgi:hypothetical protein
MRMGFSSNVLRGWGRALQGFKPMLGGALLALTWSAWATPAPLSTRTSYSVVSIVTVWSDNGAYYLRSVPYDNHLPPNYGKTTVYAADGTERYSFDRALLAMDHSPLFLSDDGESILAVFGLADDALERFRSVTVYRHGVLSRSFTRAELTGCKPREHCGLTYYNGDVIDHDKSHWGTPAYRRVFKEGISEEERFLAEFPSFSANNHAYLIDSRKQVHVFSLESGENTRSAPFAALSGELKALAHPPHIERVERQASPLRLPRLSDGRDAVEVLAQRLGLRRADPALQGSRVQLHRAHVVGLLASDGRLEVTELSSQSPRLPEAVIADFFKQNRFDARAVPREHGVWTVNADELVFQDPDEQVARREKKEADEARERMLRDNATQERLDGVYIPKDLTDCFTELDKLLPVDVREEMRAGKSDASMPDDHFTLGMRLRNTWGLWANSRLAVFLSARGIRHPDHMSGLILDRYQGWLQGRADAGTQWEREHPPLR